MNSQDKKFDPNATGSSRLGLFGVPSQEQSSKVVILPVPWEVTTSYGKGTALGPKAILDASSQLDLFDAGFGRAYEQGFHLKNIPHELVTWNDQLSPMAVEIREKLESGEPFNSADEQKLAKVNQGCEHMCNWVYKQSMATLEQGKIAAVLGGDHSTPLGLIKASCETFKGEVGVLHIDAHADLRVDYQGFKFSHASIMNNVLSLNTPPKKLVQVGIRDYCEEEYKVTQSDNRVHTFFDEQIRAEFFGGRSWQTICKEILEPLPTLVHISFDIDGLSPDLCPGTGTPVPGGLSFAEAHYLVRSLVESGRKIVSFDLNEVSPREGDEWDANVGARVLYKLCGWASASHNPCPVI